VHVWDTVVLEQKYPHPCWQRPGLDLLAPVVGFRSSMTIEL
jgi:hypothetical protein